MKQSYIFLAPGFEEIEALATLDILRRAGLKVSTVAITPGSKSKEITGAHGVTVVADILPSEVNVNEAEWLICPGGMPGATNLAASNDVTTMLKAQNAKGGKIAAICASPAVVLEPLGLLDGIEATCYPGMAPEVTKAKFTGKSVEAHPAIITGNGPASTMAFALAIVENSCGAAKANEVASGMLLK